MKLGIMQPYFFPYIGYFQLINAVDEFIVYDDIKFTKKGWINRNKILVNNQPFTFSLPLKKDHDNKMIFERYLSDDFLNHKDYLLRLIKENYKKAPFFSETFKLIEDCLLFDNKNLFNFIYNSLKLIKEYLEITTPLINSSSIGNTSNLKAENRVIAICKIRQAKTYINPIGGLTLYNKYFFKENGVDLFFIKTKEITYKQFDDTFVPNLSIIDVMMFNSKDEIKKMLNEYELI
jgi:hypothetical protein